MTDLRGLADRLAGRSLRSRLSWSASAVVAVWVVLLTLAANLLLASALADQADGVLRARAEATAITVEVAADGQVAVDEGRDDRALDIGTWIIAGNDRIVERPPGSSPALDRAALALAGRGERTTEVDGDSGAEGALRLFALPVVEGGDQAATVVTSTSLTPYQQLERLALWGSVAVALLLLVIVHLVLRANVGRALRPVQQMSEQADRWSAEDVDRRFGSRSRPTELAELAATLDGVLDRLSAVLRHEQRLTAELSHELRTPLARLRAEADLARGRAPADEAVADGLRAIDAAAADMQQIIETLLQAGRTGSRVAPGRCSPAEAVAAARAALDVRPGIRVDTDVDPRLVAGVDAAVLQRLLAPVLDNAVRYAKGLVEVRGSREPEGVLLSVADDGPGVAASDADRVFAPGWRADPGDDHPGGGLGLALSRRLAVAAGGSIRCRPGAAGGRFEIVLPPG